MRIRPARAVRAIPAAPASADAGRAGSWRWRSRCCYPGAGLSGAGLAVPPGAPTSWPAAQARPLAVAVAAQRPARRRRGRRRLPPRPGPDHHRRDRRAALPRPPVDLPGAGRDVRGRRPGRHPISRRVRGAAVPVGPRAGGWTSGSWDSLATGAGRPVPALPGQGLRRGGAGRRRRVRGTAPASRSTSTSNCCSTAGWPSWPAR